MRRLALLPVFTDLCARAFVCVLFAFLCANLLGQFLRTGQLTGLLLLTSEALVVVLTIVRRRASSIDRSFVAMTTTGISVLGPPLLRGADGTAIVSDYVTASVSAMGVLLVIVGKLSLGRSFGIAPANRGVVVRWPYTLVRHPIYTGYVISHLAFLAANLTLPNATLVLVSDVALVLRALREERLLRKDEMYQRYCRRVGWHLVPGVF